MIAARFVAAALAGIAVVLAFNAAAARRESRPQHQLRGNPIELLLKVLGSVRRLMPRLAAALGRRDTALRVQRAGLEGRIAPRDVGAARLVCVVGAAMLMPRLASALPLRMLPLATAALLVAAAELPLLLLSRRAVRRAAAICEALPDALDLLRACVAAGLPLRRSLALVSEHSAEPIAGEFAAVAAEAALGVPHSQALEAMARRNPQPEMRSLVTALTGAERDGTPLAPVIAAQAKDARQAHNREILERGARAGPKIQLIVSTMIVPGALGALAAVMIAAIAHGRIHLV